MHTDRTRFSDNILIDKETNEYEQCHCYMLYQYNKKGTFKNFNDISESVTLFHWVDTVKDFNHKENIYGCWIYDSN